MIQKILSAYKFDNTTVFNDNGGSIINAYSLRWCIKGEMSIFLGENGLKINIEIIKSIAKGCL